MAREAKRDAAFTVNQMIWLLFGILEGLIILRVGLKLIAVNPANSLASPVYGVTDLFLGPFWGLTGTLSYAGFILEIPSMVAILVYAFLAWVLVKIVWLLLFRSPVTQVVETYDDEIR